MVPYVGLILHPRSLDPVRWTKLVAGGEAIPMAIGSQPRSNGAQPPALHPIPSDDRELSGGP